VINLQVIVSSMSDFRKIISWYRLAVLKFFENRSNDSSILSIDVSRILSSILYSVHTFWKLKFGMESSHERPFSGSANFVIFGAMKNVLNFHIYFLLVWNSV